MTTIATVVWLAVWVCGPANVGSFYVPNYCHTVYVPVPVVVRSHP